MDYKDINKRLDDLKNLLFTVPRKDAEGNNIVFSTGEKNNSSRNIIVVPNEKKKLTKEEFHSEKFLEGYERCNLNDIEVGEFIRYKLKKSGEPVKYLWGGVVIFKDPEGRYIRVKNPTVNRVWSVQTNNPEIMTVFYVKKKVESSARKLAEAMDPGGTYVNLNTATPEGLMAALIDRGDEDVILKAANMIRENNRKTYII